MVRLSAFADEIAPGLDEQLRVCRECGIAQIELRTVDGVNVLDFDPQMRRDIRARLADDGIGVQTIASPIGKVTITEPWPRHFDRFKRGVEAAEFFGAPFLRVFSYYAPSPDDDIRTHRGEVLRRTQAKVDYLDGHPVVMLHENEKDLYGEKGRECADLMRSIESPKLRCAFDFANFVQAGERPRDNWPALKPYTVQIHIKDALLDGGAVVVAGAGDGDIPAILTDAYADGYRGYLSLEPHLAVAGQFSGFSGPKLFAEAVLALRGVCAAAKIPIADPD
jgi:sugar phosphate isomerase/epimerase